MTDHTRDGGTDYRVRIARDLAPVAPLRRPWTRATLLGPIAIAIVMAVPLLNGTRGDLGLHTLSLLWGATAAQVGVGLWLLGLAFREAVPGRNLSGGTLTAVALCTATYVVSMTLITNAASPTFVPHGRELQDWVECVVLPTVLGGPLVVVATLMATRAFPTRPSITGGLCGLAAGVLADSAWRISCWISQPSHVFSSHALAIVVLAATGAWIAVAADRTRWKR